jgi:hypothetical protein
MLQKLNIHNFRCLGNFEMTFRDTSSALLIGKNGVYRTTVVRALEILPRIARGANRMRDLADKVDFLIGPNDFAWGRGNVPMRFEIEVLLENKRYQYVLALDLPEGFTELRVAEEQLSVAEKIIYSRIGAQVTLHTASQNREANFMVDWHLVALPMIREQSATDPLYLFNTWLSQMVILAPIPSKMTRISDDEVFEPKRDDSNFAEWFTGLDSRYPAAYTQLEKSLRDVLADMMDIVNSPTGTDSKNLLVRCEDYSPILQRDFNELSDREKCCFLWVVVLAANKFYRPLFCFWDEPDNSYSLNRKLDILPEPGVIRFVPLGKLL